MASPHRKPPPACKQCGKERAKGYVISYRGLCRECAIANQTAAGYQVRDGEGPYYDRWRERMVELMPSKADKF